MTPWEEEVSISSTYASMEKALYVKTAATINILAERWGWVTFFMLKKSNPAHLYFIRS